MKQFTEKDVKNILDHFYDLLDSRACLTDFFEILDESFEIRYGDKVWKGWRGFEDHQERRCTSLL